MKIRLVATLLLCAGAALPLHAQTDTPPTTDTATVADPGMMPAAAMATAEKSAPEKPATVAAIEPAKSAAPLFGTLDAATGPDAPPETNPDDANGIAATVNDESISDYEVRQRVALFVATSGLTPTPEERKRIRAQILEQLENEKIQLQEAVKKHITVAPGEVDRTMNRMLSDNRVSIEQLRTMLGNAGASEAALRAQITAQIAWQKAVQEEYAERVTITPAQVDAEMRRYAEGADKPHFMVSEIFLPVDNPEQDAKVLKDAQSIESQLKMGAPFQAMARQFSQHPTAATGGQMGWVHEGQLAPELNSVLTKMASGAVSPPIRSVGGYYVLQLAARQEPLGTQIVQAPTGPVNADGSLPLARLLLPLGNAPNKDMIEQAMKFATQVRGAFKGCDQLKSLTGEVKGSVYMDLGNMKPADLSHEIQNALANSRPGEAAQPFLSDAGVELIARCDKKVEVQTAFTMPTRKQIEDNLFEQQISALARRYMRDLKRDADVEVR